MSAAIEQDARAMYRFNQTDHLAWAKRIIYRLEAGAKDLTIIQVAFAKQALGIKDEPK